MNTMFFRILPLFLSVALTLPVSAQTVSEKIFPDSTKGFFVIRNLKELGEQWRKTQIGTLMSDPVMDAFKKDVREQISQRLEDRFGWTLDGITGLPSGEVAAGMIAIPDKIPGYVFLMDIKDRRKEAETYRDKLLKKLESNGVKKGTVRYKDLDVSVLTFPPQFAEKKIKDAKDKNTDKNKEKPAAEEEERKAYFLTKDDYLIVSDQLHLVQLIADRVSDSSKNSLAGTEGFKTVVNRCQKDLPEGAKPQIVWFIDPLDYGESIRVLLRSPLAEKRKDKPSVFTVLKQQGFDAVHGIGGTVNLKSEDKESVYRIFVYAKKPYRLAMRMLVFPDGTGFEPPKWLPEDAARCTMLRVDPAAIFENFGSLFDALVMQGEEGVWADIVKGLEEDPHGPQINLRKEVIDNLGQHAVGMSHYQLPITPASESIVIAVELKKDKEEAMRNALKKLFANDTDMQSTKHRSYILWHRAPAEEGIAPPTGPTGVPDLVAPTPSVSKPKPKEEEAAEEDAPPVFPDGAVTVAKGCLFVSTNKEYLQTVLDRVDSEPKTSVVNRADYQKVHSVFKQFGITDKPHFVQFFARTDATLQPTYELVRQNKMGQSQAVLGKVLNALVAPDDSQGSRRPFIDGKNLPEFDKVKGYFGPSGLFGVSEDDGYFIKGFLLEKK
ncbi:MAG: DUF3352 domain-containing protein [Planctomycetaceae bacterium]|jgi:hypothetical protein|nr:DUF3352 domain-containing protein [Planctomycetaceae bacterium]